MSQIGTSQIDLPGLQAEIRGRAIGPDDPGYDEARTVMYGGIDRRPSVIVKVAGTDDVARVIALARDRARTGDP
jgi:hypothetical protein